MTWLLERIEDRATRPPVNWSCDVNRTGRKEGSGSRSSAQHPFNAKISQPRGLCGLSLTRPNVAIASRRQNLAESANQRGKYIYGNLLNNKIAADVLFILCFMTAPNAEMLHFK